MGSERPPSLYRVNVEGGGSFLCDRIDVGRLLVKMGEAGDDRAVSIVHQRAGEGEAIELRAEDLRIDTYGASENNQPQTVRVTHLPTGKMGEATAKSRLAARQEAIVALRAALSGRAGEPPTPDEVERVARAIASELDENFDTLEAGKAEYLRAARAALDAARQRGAAE